MENETKVCEGVEIDVLARLAAGTILDEARLASIFKVVPRTIRRMVSRHELPPAIPLGGRSVWLAGRVLAYLESMAEHAEQNMEPQIRKIREFAP